MYFDTLSLRNFGPFSELKVKFSPTGINLVTGQNGSGKTSLIGAVTFALFGSETVQYIPNGDGPCEVELSIREGDSYETLRCEVTYRDNEKKIEPTLNRTISKCLPDFERKYLHKSLVDTFENASMPSLFFQKMDLTKRQVVQEKALNSITQVVGNDQEISALWKRLKELLQSYPNRIFTSKESVASEGELEILRFVLEFSIRQEMTLSIPLFIDTRPSSLDHTASELVSRLLHSIAQKDQVVLLTSRADLQHISKKEFATHLNLDYIQRSHTPKLVSTGSNFSLIHLGQELAVKNRGVHYDVFISHATEDNEEIARPLANALMNEGLEVWYDEFSLRIGDKLRQSIDYGLANSRYGIVILSSHFLAKEWPQRELDGLTAREVNGKKVILPVWHKVTLEEVREHSPTLADRLAVSTDRGLEHVVAAVLGAIKQGSNY